jgi:hypothetical protein
MYVSGIWYRPVPWVEMTQRYFHREGSILKHMLTHVHIGTCKQLIGLLPILLLIHQPGTENVPLLTFFILKYLTEEERNVDLVLRQNEALYNVYVT